MEELRARGYTGRITLVGAEERPPYDRPPLSKKVLTDGVDPSLRADFAALDADFRPGETAVSLEPLTLVTNRDKLSFDHLVLATGAVPVTLPGPGRQRFLRTYDDALALRAVLRPGLRLAIIGAGWIGAELATAAAAAGCQVTVVEAGPAPLAAALGADAGSRTAPWYDRAGVELRTGTGVASVGRGGLALADGGWLPADEVVTAVGVRPAVSWLAGASALPWRTASPSTPGCVPRCRASTRPGTAPRSSPCGSASDCGSSTGTWRCTRRRWSRPTSSAVRRCTTRCRTSGPSSSAR